MTAADHRVELEELMASLDGELPKADAERVRAHVVACDECRRLEIDMRDVSSRMSQWIVPAAPESLVPVKRRAVLLSSRWVQIAALLVLVATGGVVWQITRPQRSTPAALADRAPMEVSLSGSDVSYAVPGRSGVPAPEAQVGGPGPLILRTARLTLVARELDAARADMERIVMGVGGYIGQIAVSDVRTGARSLGATVRIPADRLDETLKAFKSLGQVTFESQQGEDVTQQSVDLDARLANARASEARLKQILGTRTGRLSDVLDVEREIARVRGEIEQMEAQRKSLDRRITYAEVTLQMNEERKAAVDFGPLPLGTQLRNALVDGWSSAITGAVEAMMFIARIAPALLLWGLVLALPAWLIKRRFAR